MRHEDVQRSEDAQLIEAYLAGDENGFTTLVRKYEKRLQAYAYRKIHNYQTAEEIVQDAFYKAYVMLSSLTEPDKFVGWIHAITKRLCIDWIRKENQKKTLQTEPLHTCSAELVDIACRRYQEAACEESSKAAQSKRVQELLQKLPKVERRVVRQHYLNGWTCQEIAESFGMSPNTVKSHLYRARKRLKCAYGVESVKGAEK